MRQSDIPEIRDLPLFRDMDDENFDALIRGAYVQTFPPQIELITEGDTSDFLHIVIEGAVEQFASWNGNETTMAIVRPISTFILAATIKDAPYLMSARTIEKARIVLVPSTDVRTIFAKDAVFARSVVSELAQCYRSVVKQSKNLKLRTSIERLANYMLRKHNEHAQSVEFDIPMEKRVLASYLGMTPENLSRAIKTLRLYGVEITGNRVRLSNVEDLKALAKPTPFIDDPHR